MKLQGKYLKEASAIHQPGRFDGSRHVGWKSPSNIALVKYWGKKEMQIPQNPSLSFSLKKSFTETSVEYSLKKHDQPALEFYFEGENKPDFKRRIQKFINHLDPYMPFLKELDMKIDSVNSFPHSSGIASSASAMSALALCFVSIENNLFGTQKNRGAFFMKASFLARLGSGSAARSVYGSFVLWGKSTSVPFSDDEMGVQVQFPVQNGSLDLADAILITSQREKKVGSSAGHSQMENHPWAENRYNQAREHLESLMKAMINKDDDQFIRIIEREALSLHALMMTSDKGFTLMNENTWKIIKAVRDFREQQKIFVAFTLDAGPNVHLIYRLQDKPRVTSWINKELVKYCENGYWIDDEIGPGPVELN